MNSIWLQVGTNLAKAQGMSSCFLAILSVIGIVSVSQGCSPKYAKLDQRELARLREDNSILAVHYVPPSFAVMTPDRAIAGGLFGAAGGAVARESMLSTGDQMIRDFQLENPSLLIKRKFLSSLGGDVGPRNIQLIEQPLSDDGLDELKKTFGQSTVIDFKTTNWGLLYYPTDWSHYRVQYWGRARLVRLAESKVVWETGCSYLGQDPSMSPTMDQLTANKGELLKAKLDEALGACEEEFIAAFLGREKSGK